MLEYLNNNGIRTAVISNNGWSGEALKGAHNAGIFPVWYKGDIPTKDLSVRNDGEEAIDFDYLHIHDWLEMVEVLEEAE